MINLKLTLFLFFISIPLISAGGKTALLFRNLGFYKRKDRIGLKQNIFSFWDTTAFTKIFGILDVPQIGTKKDRKGKAFRHNAASRGYRHGDKSTEIVLCPVNNGDQDAF